MTLKNGQAFTNSVAVAEFFKKGHRNVRRDIQALIETVPACALNFAQSWIEVPLPNGGSRVKKTYDMTKDGFTLLAMGFTGAKALEFKLKYIATFDELEAKASAAVMALPDFTNPAAAARAWADEVEQKSQGLSSSLRPL